MKPLKTYNLGLLRNREWYHQRFDGCPLFIWFIADADFYPDKRRPKGTEPQVRVCFYDPGMTDWYLDMQDVRRGAAIMIKLAKKDPEISKKLLWAWKKDEQKFERFFWEEFPKINLKRLSDQQLFNLWQKNWLMAIKRFTSSTVIDHFALGTDETIGEMLRKELRGAFKKETEFTNLFSIATAPVHQSFINQAEIDLLKIILMKSRESLSSYQKRYFWTKNNYFIAQNLTVEHFKKEIKAWKQSGKNLKTELERIENTPKNSKITKQKLLKKYPLSRLLRTLLKISEDFTYWQDERKKATYMNIHIGSKIIEEISKRTGYKILELKYAFPREIETIMLKRYPSKKELAERYKKLAVVLNHKGWYTVTGSAAQKAKKLILGDKGLTDIMDFRGLSASTGKAVGRVRIVKSATQVGKVKVGDILVAVMTRPDYVVGMKKAAAIVTNEGGITSHAAIVSRELGIPCIIGTKIATEVLKDGDLVEVNANHGWVRKIKKIETI